MSQRSEIVGIQFLRGICAVAVVADHAAGMVAMPKYFGAPVLDGRLLAGMFGVDIFFVISGFIIALVALRAEDLKPAISAGTFLKRRFVRIVPIMWVAILSYALLQFVFVRSVDPMPYVRALFLVPDGRVKPDMIWTLRHEALFYLLFCLALFGRRWRLLLLAAWFAAPVAFALVTGGWTVSTNGVDSLRSITMSPVNLEFAAGFAIGILWLRARGRSLIHLPVHPLAVLCGLAGGAMLTAHLSPSGSQSLPVTAFMAVAGGALVLFAAMLHCPAGPLTGVGRLLGDASYAIYLFHLHVSAALLTLWSKALPATPPAAVVVGIAVTATLAGIAAHFLVERPLVRTVQSWLSHRGKPIVPPSLYPRTVV